MKKHCINSRATPNALSYQNWVRRIVEVDLRSARNAVPPVKDRNPFSGTRMYGSPLLIGPYSITRTDATRKIIACPLKLNNWELTVRIFSQSIGNCESSNATTSNDKIVGCIRGNIRLDDSSILAQMCGGATAHSNSQQGGEEKSWTHLEVLFLGPGGRIRHKIQVLVTLQNLSIAQTTCASRKKRFSDINLWNRNSICAGNADAVSPRAQPVTESSLGRLSMWSYNYGGD